MVIDQPNRESHFNSYSLAARLHERACNLLTTEIGFIDNESFRSNIHWQTLQNALEFVDARNESIQVRSGTLIRRVCDLEILDRQQEISLFLSMNLLKCRANAFRSKIDLEAIDVDVIRDIDRFCNLSMLIRDHLVQSNVRLVVSIVKTFLKPSREFDDLFSDGVDALMRAVEKFDFDRGFRFSTYATMVIRRHLGRQLQKGAERSQRFVVSTATHLDAIEHRPECSDFERMTSKEISGLLSRMMDDLDERERHIIQQRFGFTNANQKRTLNSLAVELGVCKERVRQLEQRALKKLRKMSQRNDLKQLGNELQ